MGDFYGHRPRPYYGPRFFRLTCTKERNGELEMTGATYGQNRMHAVSDARSVYIPAGYTVVLETLDDRYPANVLNRETIEPKRE